MLNQKYAISYSMQITLPGERFLLDIPLGIASSDDRYFELNFIPMPNYRHISMDSALLPTSFECRDF